MKQQKCLANNTVLCKIYLFWWKVTVICKWWEWTSQNPLDFPTRKDACLCVHTRTLTCRSVCVPVSPWVWTWMHVHMYVHVLCSLLCLVNTYESVCMCAYMCLCVCCVHYCVHVWVHSCLYKHALCTCVCTHVFFPAVGWGATSRAAACDEFLRPVGLSPSHSAAGSPVPAAPARPQYGGHFY